MSAFALHQPDPTHSLEEVRQQAFAEALAALQRHPGRLRSMTPEQRQAVINMDTPETVGRASDFETAWAGGVFDVR